MKDNLKYICNTNEDYNEAYYLMDSLKSHSLNGTASELNLIIDPKYDIRRVTIEELRELAKPREYLDENFKLVETNQPKEGWRLVPDRSLYLFEDRYGKWFNKHMPDNPASKILWQRENKVETSKGRFLHQEWYEAFGRGEALEYSYPLNGMWVELSDSKHTMSIFNGKEVTFRIKPQTIQIGSRTINKPISVKPEKGSCYFIADPINKLKYRAIVSNNSEMDAYYFERSLCHLTAADAVAQTEAILELFALQMGG